MGYSTIDLSRDGAVAVLRFNRPESYNALNHQMGPELQDASIEIQADPDVRAVLITGEGSAFHAGGDVKSFVSQGDSIPTYIDRLVIPFHAFISHLVRMPKPVVGAVNGVAAGAGFSIALACDLLVASTEAVFTVAYSRIGASPDGAMSYFLPRHVGARRAMELYLTNRVLNAQEALELGLVAQAVAPDKLMDVAMEQARTLADGPTQAYGRAKELFYQSLNNQLETQMELEARAIIASSRTEDFREGTTAFSEKRPAAYKGK